MNIQQITPIGMPLTDLLSDIKHETLSELFEHECPGWKCYDIRRRGALHYELTAYRLAGDRRQVLVKRHQLHQIVIEGGTVRFPKVSHSRLSKLIGGFH